VGAASRPLPRCWSSHAKCPRLPIFKRAAIQVKSMVVLKRNSRAKWTFPAHPYASAPWQCHAAAVRVSPIAPAARNANRAASTV